MREIFEFLPLWLWICLLVTFILIIIAFFTNKKVKKVIYTLVIDAEEKLLGSKRGKEKLAMVIEGIRSKLPNFMQIFFTEDYIIKLIEQAVVKMKKELEKLDKTD